MNRIHLRQLLLGSLFTTLFLAWLHLSSLLFYSTFFKNHVSKYSVHIARENIYDNKRLVEIGSMTTRHSEIPDETIPDNVQFENPNLPIDFWNRFGKFSTRFRNSNCFSFPKLSSLQFSNNFWQVFKTSEMSFMLFNAYYDDRELNDFGPCVRIISMISAIVPSFQVHCQLWFEGFQDPLFTEAAHYEYMWRPKWETVVPYYPFLITCNIPSRYQNQIPAVVTLVESRCENATNALRIFYVKPFKRKEIAVCVKALDFFDQDISVRLVEWIELLGILGADKIFFYKYHVHRNISKVLQYYQKLNRVDVTPTTQPGEIPNIPFLQKMFSDYFLQMKRRNEVIQYNDCLYRNLNSYKYIAMIDVDEVFIPKNVDSWQHLIKQQSQAKEMKIAAFCSKSVLFLDNFDEQLIIDSSHAFEHMPKYMHILQHVNRNDKKDLFDYSKCFHNTELVVSVHNHFPTAHFENEDIQGPVMMPDEDVLLHHYRAQCLPRKKECKTFVADTSVWKFRDELIRRSTKTLRVLDFIVLDNVSVSIPK